MKQTINVNLHNFDDDCLDGSIQRVIDYLTSYRDAPENAEFDSLNLEKEPAYEGGYYVRACGTRLETDEEEGRRIKNSAYYEEQRLQREREEYERLKVKFEPSKTI